MELKSILVDLRQGSFNRVDFVFPNKIAKFSFFAEIVRINTKNRKARAKYC